VRRDVSVRAQKVLVFRETRLPQACGIIPSKAVWEFPHSARRHDINLLRHDANQTPTIRKSYQEK